jgi:hypothetical protein
MMGFLPFEASFDALAWIVKQIRVAAASTEVDDLVPALSVSFNSCSWDQATGRILEYIPYEHYKLGWYGPGDLTDAVEVDIWGRRVFVLPETLKLLAGKRLVLARVDSGGKSTPQGDRQLLIAVAR